MQKFEVDGTVYEYPAVEVVSADPATLRITEGEYAGVVFSIANPEVVDGEGDDEDAYLNYQLEVVDANNRGLDLEKVKDFADAFLIKCLMDEASRQEQKQLP